jgi:hypothetical protein
MSVQNERDLYQRTATAVAENPEPALTRRTRAFGTRRPSVLAVASANGTFAETALPA